MTGSKAARLALDLAMTVLVLVAFAYHLTGNTAHEWIGANAFALVAVHLFVNRRWYKNHFAGKYPPRRILTTTVNWVLVAAMATVLVSGLLLSREVFPLFKAADDLLMRKIHTKASYWSLLLVAVHIGLHWSMISQTAVRLAGRVGPMRRSKLPLRLAAALIASGGVAASFDRNMGSKLFVGDSFDFWDPGRPALLFFAANLAIMGLYVGVTYYLTKIMSRRPKVALTARNTPRPQ